MQSLGPYCRGSVGTLIIRTGFLGMLYHTIIVRSPQNSVGNDEGHHLRFS